MSDVIDFLERMGRDAQLRNATREQLESELAALGIDGAIRTALLDGDTRSLERLLGATANVCCLIEKPDEEEDQPSREPPAEPADDEDEDEDDADSWRARRSAASRARATH